MTKRQKALIALTFILGLGVVVNLTLIDYEVFLKKPSPLPSQSTIESQPVSPESSLKVVDSCYPRSCVDLIREATASLGKVTEKPSVTTKEFFVHLGSGSSTANDWTDVPGVEAYIDSTKYGRIKNAYFEASLHTPTGNQTAYVRLYNVTDKHYVWPSELFIEGGEPKLLVSPSMTLPSGNKLYRVQMKTQLRSLTNLVQARVRIITE